MVAVVQVDLGGYQRVSVKAEEMAIAVASPKPAFHDSITPNLVLRVEDRQTCPCVVPIPASKWWITNESNNSDEKKTCISPRHHPPIRSPRVGGGCVRTHQRVIIAPATTKSNDISHHLSICTLPSSVIRLLPHKQARKHASRKQQTSRQYQPRNDVQSGWWALMRLEVVRYRRLQSHKMTMSGRR